jgi:hypothetical protein
VLASRATVATINEARGLTAERAFAVRREAIAEAHEDCRRIYGRA